HKRREARVSGIQPEINETSLQCQEGTNRAVASHNLGAKESVQDSEIARNKCDAAGIARVCKSLGEGLFEVIIHLAFQHDVRKRLVTHSCSQPSHVGFCL